MLIKSAIKISPLFLKCCKPFDNALRDNFNCREEFLQNFILTANFH